MRTAAGETRHPLLCHARCMAMLAAALPGLALADATRFGVDADFAHYTNVNRAALDREEQDDNALTVEGYAAASRRLSARSGLVFRGGVRARDFLDFGDLGSLVELEGSAFADPWNPSQVFAELDDRHAFVLIALGGVPRAPLGFAVFRHIAGEAELLRLGVSPTARRKGVGRRLTQAGLDRLRAMACDGCYLEVRTNNTGAIALYESLDFRRTGLRRRYYSDGTDALLMKRDLGVRS